MNFSYTHDFPMLKKFRWVKKPQIRNEVVKGFRVGFNLPNSLPLHPSIPHAPFLLILPGATTPPLVVPRKLKQKKFVALIDFWHFWTFWHRLEWLKQPFCKNFSHKKNFRQEKRKKLLHKASKVSFSAKQNFFFS